MEPLTISVEEACRYIGVKKTRFYELLATPGTPLETVKLGHRRLVKLESLKRLIASLSEAA